MDDRWWFRYGDMGGSDMKKRGGDPRFFGWNESVVAERDVHAADEGADHVVEERENRDEDGD